MKTLRATRRRMLGASTLSLAIVLPIAMVLLIFALDITRIMVIRLVLLDQVQNIGETARLQSAMKFQQEDLIDNWQANAQQGFLSSVSLQSFEQDYFDDINSWLESPDSGQNKASQNSCCMSLSLNFSTATLTQFFTNKKSWNFRFIRLIYFEGKNE